MSSDSTMTMTLLVRTLVTRTLVTVPIAPNHITGCQARLHIVKQDVCAFVAPAIRVMLQLLLMLLMLAMPVMLVL